MKNDKDNIIVNLTFQVTLDIIDFTKHIQSLKKDNLANQLFRSGTGIGANVNNAQNAESTADLIHKLKIAAKKPMKLSIG